MSGKNIKYIDGIHDTIKDAILLLELSLFKLQKIDRAFVEDIKLMYRRLLALSDEIINNAYLYEMSFSDLKNKI